MGQLIICMRSQNILNTYNVMLFINNPLCDVIIFINPTEEISSEGFRDILFF